MANFDKRLRNILVKRGCLDAERADEAVQSAEGEGRSLSQVVVEHQYVDERDLIAAVAQEMHMPPIDVGKVAYDPEVLEVVPQDLAKYYGVLPIAKVGDILTLAVSNPFDILKLDDLRIVTGCNIRPVVSTENAIDTAITKAYDTTADQYQELLSGLVDPEMEITDQDSVEDADDDDGTDEHSSPVIRLVNHIVHKAVTSRVSDIHIEPMERRLRIRFRRDGVLEEFRPGDRDPPKKLQAAITSRVKIMAKLDIAEKRVPQDGKFQTKVANRKIDFRVSTLPLVYGEKVVMRILDSSNLALDLESLGFEDQAYRAFKQGLAAPFGMVLVTGPTGSGKTTTLYSSLKEVARVEDNIVTVEDPVEYELEGINQVAVNPKRGLTFARALRSILRQDPDTVMIGEMRDTETVNIAAKAALTGHLVLSTLHTNDAPSTISRLTDMGLEPFLVSSTVLLVSAQRLSRRVCSECAEEVSIPETRLLAIGFTEEDIAQKPLFVRAKGCSVCGNGYTGRFALIEALYMTDRIKRMVLEGATAPDIKDAAVEEGMITLRRCGLLNAVRGKTTVEEVLRGTAADEAKVQEALD
ncbi:GspE/PulE family protein [Planctomycetota bacterium]